MNKKGTKALASATLMSLVLTTALATGNVKAAANGQATRVGGTDRYETAAKVATTNFTTSDNVVLVSGEGYADSVSASVLAKKLDAPIVLTGSKTLDANAKSAIETLKAKNVYIIGGTGSISASIESGLKSNYTVTRLGGKDRYATNLAIANKLVDLGVSKDNIIAVAGTGFADALSVAPVAATDNEILLLTKNDTDAMKATADFAKDSNVTVVGTTNVVNGDIYNQLKADKRIDGGADRFATNIKVLNAFDSDLKADKLYVANATGNGYADALVASAIAGKYAAPLVLTDTESSTGTTNAINYIGKKATLATDLQVVGGTGVVSDDTVSAIEDAVKGDFDGTVTSVEAVKDQYVNAKEDGEQLQFTVNGGVKVTAQDLIDKDYQVKFITDQPDSINPLNNPATDGSNTDGKLDKSKLNALYTTNNKDSFKYQVIVSKDGAIVAQSDLTKVNIISGDVTANTLSDVTLNLGGYDDDADPEITSSTLVKDETAYVTKVKGNSVDGKSNVTINDPNITYTSSNPFVAKVEKVEQAGKYYGKITAKATGNFDLVIKSGNATKTVSLKVTDQTRKATTAKLSTSTLTVGNGNDNTFDMNVYDQYGDAVTGGTKQASPANKDFTFTTDKSGTDSIIDLDTIAADKTDNDGKTTVKVKGIKTGTDTLYVKNVDGKILGRVSVNVKNAGSVDSYKLNVQGDNNGTLDLNPDSADNNGTSKFKFKIGQYDTSGNFLGYVNSGLVDGSDSSEEGLVLSVVQPNTGNKQILTSGNSKVITKTADDGTITFQTGFETENESEGKYNILKPNGDTGTLTIQLKNNKTGVVKATKTITVTDSSPVISGATFASNQTIGTGKDIALDDLIKPENISLGSSSNKGDGKVKIDKQGDIFIKYNNTDVNADGDAYKSIDSDDTDVYFIPGKDIYLGHIVTASSDETKVTATQPSDGKITFNLTNVNGDSQTVTVGIVKAQDTTPSYTTTVTVVK
ncbi:cell wall-binding repeat-containing protein [Clostridium tyrobutyricum]|uniref:cell wall-binding repeat-containing protein n=1 Tax=Clostridium tyrobutyricum TaxID=1519 RepID=UPI0039F71DD7